MRTTKLTGLCLFVLAIVVPTQIAADGFTNEENWSAFDAGAIGGEITRGYFGAAFDGRHIYFAPCRTNTFHGIALRYDTQNDFKNSSSWESYDAGQIDGLDTKGYAGAIFDGTFVYYVPFCTMSGRHGRVMRYDPLGSFSSATSWQAFDADPLIGLPTSGFSGGVYDGRYIYFAPFGYDPIAHGHVLRYDTQGSFKQTQSWSVYDASFTDGLNTRGYYGAGFDGRYVYFVPFNDGSDYHGRTLRYDTQGTFSSPSSWSAYDAGNTEGQITVGYKGAVVSGDYVFFVPFRDASVRHGRVLRYDRKGDFHMSSSWSAYDAGNIGGMSTRGYVGAELAGKYIYFVPYSGDGNIYHARMLRYDTSAPFKTASSWSAYDAGSTDGMTTKGYKFSACDGQYVYFTPYHNNINFSGIALRYRLPGEPIPDIKANGSDGPVTIKQSDVLNLEVALNPNDAPVVDYDWWILADTAFGWYSYRMSTHSFVPGLAVTHQGQLFAFGPNTVFSGANLPVGSYEFFFGVDAQMNGVPDMNVMYLDSVGVTVTRL